ncbi:unnamed protein product, partial [Ixodes persulcatus]
IHTQESRCKRQTRTQSCLEDQLAALHVRATSQGYLPPSQPLAWLTGPKSPQLSRAIDPTVVKSEELPRNSVRRPPCFQANTQKKKKKCIYIYIYKEIRRRSLSIQQHGTRAPAESRAAPIWRRNEKSPSCVVLSQLALLFFCLLGGESDWIR